MAVSALFPLNVPNRLFIWMFIHYIFLQLPTIVLNAVPHWPHGCLIPVRVPVSFCQTEGENWNHKWQRPNSVGQACKWDGHHWHLLMCLASLMLNIIVENADDNGPQKGPVGIKSTFPPSVFRMWVSAMLAIKEFRFLDLHDLVVMWLTSVQNRLPLKHLILKKKNFF